MANIFYARRQIQNIDLITFCSDLVSSYGGEKDHIRQRLLPPEIQLNVECINYLVWTLYGYDTSVYHLSQPRGTVRHESWRIAKFSSSYPHLTPTRANSGFDKNKMRQFTAPTSPNHSPAPLHTRTHIDLTAVIHFL